MLRESLRTAVATVLRTSEHDVYDMTTKSILIFGEAGVEVQMDTRSDYDASSTAEVILDSSAELLKVFVSTARNNS